MGAGGIVSSAFCLLYKLFTLDSRCFCCRCAVWELVVLYPVPSACSTNCLRLTRGVFVVGARCGSWWYCIQCLLPALQTVYAPANQKTAHRTDHSRRLAIHQRAWFHVHTVSSRHILPYTHHHQTPV